MNKESPISINGQIIEIGERISIDLGFNVEACLILPDKIIVVLDSNNYEPIDKNVKCYNYNGLEMWNIEAGVWPEKYDCPVTGIWQNKGRVMVFRRCGFEQELDVETRKELNSEFTK